MHYAKGDESIACMRLRSAQASWNISDCSEHIRTHSLYHQMSSTFRDRELQLAMDIRREPIRSCSRVGVYRIIIPHFSKTTTCKSYLSRVFAFSEQIIDHGRYAGHRAFHSGILVVKQQE